MHTLSQNNSTSVPVTALDAIKGKWQKVKTTRGQRTGGPQVIALHSLVKEVDRVLGENPDATQPILTQVSAIRTHLRKALGTLSPWDVFHTQKLGIYESFFEALERTLDQRPLEPGPNIEEPEDLPEEDTEDPLEPVRIKKPEPVPRQVEIRSDDLPPGPYFSTVNKTEACELWMKGHVLLVCDRGARAYQEDRIAAWQAPNGLPLLRDTPICLAVIDGMGGPGDGDRAAEMFVDAFIPNEPTSRRSKAFRDTLTAVGGSMVALKELANSSSGYVFASAEIKDDFAVIMHVGDSRGAVYRKGAPPEELILITVDNNYPRVTGEKNEDLERRQRIQKTNVVQDPIMGRSEEKGWDELLGKADTLRLRTGDILFLMTDGCHEAVASTDLIKELARLSDKHPEDDKFADAVKAALAQFQRQERVSDNFTLLAYAHKCTLRETLKVWQK